MKPMRLKAVLRETWRNVATGTSRCALIWLLLSICAVACMCADLTQMTGLIGDAWKWKESGASTYAITLQGGIDGAACEGLRSANGVLGAAALRQSSDRVRIASLPATEIPTYEASAHVAQVFAPMPNPVSAPLRAPPLPGRVEATKRRMRKSAGSIPCWGRICLARRISMPASPGMRHC